MEKDYKRIVYLGNLSRTLSQSGQVIYRGGCCKTLCAGEWKANTKVIKKWIKPRKS